jgi:hypothetical protein
MCIIAIDIGIKNLCIVIVNNNEVKVSNLYKLPVNYIKEAINVLKSVIPISPEIVLIEKQLNKNIKCSKVEIAIEVYCLLNNIKYKKIHPNDKYKKYNISFPKYNERKKWVVEKGRYLFGDYYNYSIDSFKKKDDLCDCIIMIHLYKLEMNKDII